MTYEQLDRRVNQELDNVCNNISVLCKRISVPQSKVSSMLGFQSSYLSHALAKKKLSANVLLKIVYYFGLPFEILKCGCAEFNEKTNDKVFCEKVKKHTEKFNK